MLRRMLLTGALVTIVGLAGVGAQSPPVTARDAQTYVNARFRFRVTWPADVLTALDTPDDADGQSFTAPGVVVRAHGSRLRQYGRLRELYDAELAARGDTVQYRRLERTFFVLSGVKDGRVHYRKALVASDERLLVLDAEYDVAQRDRYDPVVRDMARSLGPL